MNRRFLAVDGRGVLSVEEEPMPPHGPGEVLVEVHASLVSPGTEMGGVKNRRMNPSDAPPRGFGYSNAGIVLEAGDGCEALVPGQRLACMGIVYDAPHSTLGNCPKNLAFPIPESLGFDEAAFNHLAATSLNAVRRMEPQLGEYVAIVGLGIVGQVASQLARLCGARVIGLDRVPMRLDLARQLGADAVVNVAEQDPVEAVKAFTGGYGLDAAMICFGGDGTEAFELLLKMMKLTPDTHQMGRIVVPGGCRINTSFAAHAGNIDLRSAARTGPGFLDDDWEHGADYTPVFIQWTTRRNVQLCLDLMVEGKLRVKELITHRVPLDGGPAACDELIEHPERALGVILLPQA